MSLVLIYTGAFVASAVLDLSFAHWVRAVVCDQLRRAMLLSGLYYTISSCCTVIFVDDPGAIPACVLGHVLGTYAAMRFRGQGQAQSTTEEIASSSSSSSQGQAQAPSGAAAEPL